MNLTELGNLLSIPDLENAILSMAASLWVYPVTFILVVLDAFLVIIPSEVIVVALATLSISAGVPNLWLLVLTASIGAIVGDSLCYLFGKLIGTTRFKWMRNSKIQAALNTAKTALNHRAATIIFTARYIPFARIAVNLTAGSTGFIYSRFLMLSVFAGITWAIYNTVIGAVFGYWFNENPLLAMLLSIVSAIVVGVIIDTISSILHKRKQAKQALRNETRPESGINESESELANLGLNEANSASDSTKPTVTIE